MTLRDPEVLDLLADDPTLLALADAVVATQQAPRRPLFRRRAPRVAVVAVVAAAAVIVALVLPQGKHGIVDRAIAAIGDGRVMHIVSEMPTGTVDVDLQSGRRTVQQARVEVWADQQLKRFHVVMTIEGQVVLDLLWPQDAEEGRYGRGRRPRVCGPLDGLPGSARRRHGDARRRRRRLRSPRLLAAFQPHGGEVARHRGRSRRRDLQAGRLSRALRRPHHRPAHPPRRERRLLRGRLHA